jgi:hypothetical protein
MLPGCGARGQKPVYPAKGRVLYGGKPLPQAFVVLHPVGDDDKRAVRPSALADNEGVFVLGSCGKGDGAPAGDYIATVEWRPLVGEEPEPGPNRLHPRYSKAATSDLRVRIEPGPNDQLTLNLQP